MWFQILFAAQGGFFLIRAAIRTLPRSLKETCPILSGMKDTDHHDGFLKWLVKDEIISKFRHDEPADWLVSHGGFPNTPSQFLMLCEQVGGIENGLPHPLRRLGMVGNDVASYFLQIQRGSWAEFGPDQDRRRNSSVVRD